jgi:hypothetical protein
MAIAPAVSVLRMRADVIAVIFEGIAQDDRKAYLDVAARCVRCWRTSTASCRSSAFRA